MLGCKPANTPIESNHKLGEKYEEPMVEWWGNKFTYCTLNLML